MAAACGEDARERVGIDVAAEAPPLAPAEPAIDRAHLARMTHGERDLEREVLQLYATQADILLGRMLRKMRIAAAAIAALAHTLERVVARDRRLAGRGRGGRRRSGCGARPRHGCGGRAAGSGDPRRAASDDRASLRCAID